MHSPLARVILTVLAGYLIILFVLTIFDWYQAEFPGPRSVKPNTKRIQHPFHHRQAVQALEGFSQLTDGGKTVIKHHLNTVLLSLDQWLAHLAQSNYRIICMGELHEESTRIFLADAVFSKLPVQVLMLEVTADGLGRLLARMNAGRGYFPLLGADIMNVLRNVTSTNPEIKIFGIEETEEQQNSQSDISGARDRSIARNFWNCFHPGLRHVILFGALHCTNEPNWLFHRIRGQAPLPLSNQMLNVLVLEEHQRGPLEAFVYFLDKIGIEKKDFVIPDTGGLHSWIYERFPQLHRQLLQKYSALIVFRQEEHLTTNEVTGTFD
jgi:hypothetical protein